MASKGQKFNSFSNELKTKVIEEYNSGVSYSSLSHKYNISAGTIKTWVFKTKQGINVCKDNRGRPKNGENIDYKERYEILKNYQAFLKAQREKK